MCQPWRAIKQNAVVRLGLRRDSVQPIWGAVTIIVDEVTLSGKGEIEVTAVMQMNTKILRAAGFFKQQQIQTSIGRGRDAMALEVLAGPGCDSVGKEAYIADKLGPDDVVISVGRIFKALTLGSDVPSTNTAALRMALYLQTTAIRNARERQLSGFILTGNGNRQRLDKLAAEAGVSRVIVLKMTPAQACAAVRRVVSGDERIAACDEGIKRRWFGSISAWSE